HSASLDTRYPLPPFVFFSSHAPHRALHSFPTRRSSDLIDSALAGAGPLRIFCPMMTPMAMTATAPPTQSAAARYVMGSEIWVGEIGRDTSELQSLTNLVCRLLLEKKKEERTSVIRRCAT